MGEDRPSTVPSVDVDNGLAAGQRQHDLGAVGGRMMPTGEEAGDAAAEGQVVRFDAAKTGWGATTSTW